MSERKERDNIERARTSAYLHGRTPDEGEERYRKSKAERQAAQAQAKAFLEQTPAPTNKVDKRKEEQARTEAYRKGLTPEQGQASYRVQSKSFRDYVNDEQARRDAEAKAQEEARLAELKKNPNYREGKSNDDEFLAFRDLQAQAKAQGSDISQGKYKERLKTDPETGNEYIEGRATAKFTLPKQAESEPIIQGIQIVGSTSPQTPLDIDASKAANNRPQTEKEFLAEKAKEGFIFTGEKTTDPVTGATTYQFYNKNERDNLIRDQNNQERVLKANATYIGYKATPEYAENGEVTGYTFEPRKGQSQFTVKNTQGVDVTSEFLRGEIQESQYNQLKFEENPNPEKFNPNLGEQLYRSTAGYGGQMLAGILDLAAEGEIKLVEAFGGQGGDKIRKSTKAVTDNIRDATSLNALGKFYNDIGNASGSEAYKQAGAHALEQAKHDTKPVVGVIEAGAGFVAGQFGSEEGKQVVKDFQEQTEKRPLETITSGTIDIGSLFVGGGEAKGATSVVKVARVTKQADIGLDIVENVGGKTVTRSITGTLENPKVFAAGAGTGISRAAADKPINVSRDEAKTAGLEAIKRSTGETVNPAEVKIVNTKTVQQGNRLETVPTKGKEKPSGYELVNKEGETLAVITKKGVSVTTKEPLKVTGAGKAVGQRLSRSGEQFEDITPKTDELFATDYTQYVTSEAKGLKEASKGQSGVTKITGSAKKNLLGEDIADTETRTLISEPTGELRAPKTIEQDVLTYNTKQTSKAALDRKVTESIKTQSEKFHNTDPEILKYYQKVPGDPVNRLTITNDPILRGKVAKTERLVANEAKKLDPIESEITNLDNELSAVNAEKASIQSEVTVLEQPSSELLGAMSVEQQLVRESRISELTLKTQALDEKAASLAEKKAGLENKKVGINEKIDKIRERRALRRSDFLGARQRVFEEEITRVDTPIRGLEKKGVTRQNASGLTGTGSATSAARPTAVTEQVAKPVEPLSPTTKAKISEEAFQAERTTVIPDINVDTRSLSGIGIGGNASEYSNREIIGLGGRTGLEKKRKPTPLEEETVFFNTPAGTEPVGPLSTFMERIKANNKPTERTVDKINIISTNMFQVDEVAPKVNTSIDLIPQVTERQSDTLRTGNKTRDKTKTDTIPFNITSENSKVDVKLNDGFRFDQPQITGNGSTTAQRTTTGLPNIEIPRTTLPRIFAPLPKPSGGGGSIRQGREFSGASGISDLAVANPLFAPLSIRGSGEQSKAADRLLDNKLQFDIFDSGKKKTVKPKKKKQAGKSILDIF